MIDRTPKVGDSIYDSEGYLGRIKEIKDGVAKTFWPENCVWDNIPIKEIDGTKYMFA